MRVADVRNHHSIRFYAVCEHRHFALRGHPRLDQSHITAGADAPEAQRHTDAGIETTGERLTLQEGDRI